MLEIITPATDYPVTLQEAKAQLAIDDGVQDFNGLIVSYIKAATASVEQYTGLKLMAQTVKLWLPCFPVDDVDLSVAPVRSVDSVAYWDADGDQQALATPGDYFAQVVGAYPRLAAVSSWPVTEENNPAGVSVSMAVGYLTRHDVPDMLKVAILMRVHEMFDNRGETVPHDNLTPTTLTVNALCDPYRRRRAG